MPTEAPDSANEIAAEFESDSEREEFLRQLEAEFAPRRFTNAADAFDTVKAWIQEHTTKTPGGDPRDGHK